MLVLSRKLGEKVCIGTDIIVMVLAVKGNQIRIGIDAPAAVPVMRSELVGARRGSCASSQGEGFQREEAPRACR